MTDFLITWKDPGTSLDTPIHDIRIGTRTERIAADSLPAALDIFTQEHPDAVIVEARLAHPTAVFSDDLVNRVIAELITEWDWDEVETFEGYEAYDFNSHAIKITNVLRDLGVLPGTMLCMESDSDGMLENALMLVPSAGRPTYAISLDFRELTDDRSATGRQAIAAMISALIARYNTLRG